MNADSQAATLAYLTRPDVHGVPAGEIVTIHTHISTVVLAGESAYKLKRAVRFPYIDLSSPAKRLASCVRELELNRRSAPALYVAVRRITRGRDGHLSFDGTGEMVDAVVQMRRFADDALLETQAQQGKMTSVLAARVAGVIADFHDRAEVVHDVDVAPAMAGILAAIEALLAGQEAALPGQGRTALCEALRRELKARDSLMAGRGPAGKVRHCHGDLHLRNICVIDGVPTLFDCIDFDDALARIDVLYDLAFLLMDLWSRGFAQQANAVLNRYMDARDDDDGIPLLPLYMALRAAIRAHVVATQAMEAPEGARDGLLAQARRYLDTGLSCLSHRPARLVAIGGLSGSGKSSVAAALAHDVGPAPGARILSSDRIRKHMLGVPMQAPLPPQAYRADVSERVYAWQAERAAQIAAAGHGAIADAVFERQADRTRIAQCASRAGVPFSGFWLQAPAGALISRVNARTHDPSDADERIVRAQLARQPDVKDWISVDAGGPLEAAVACVLQRLDGHG